MTTTVEQDIKDKGLVAPRVTVADIEAEITSEHYFTAAEAVFLGTIAATVAEAASELGITTAGAAMPPPSETLTPLDLLTFCVLVLKNGYTVTGESACASAENFDADIGRKVARENAVNKIWPLLGFRLRDELSRPVLDEAYQQKQYPPLTENKLMELVGSNSRKGDGELLPFAFARAIERAHGIGTPPVAT